MHPTLFNIGSFSVPSYGTMLAMSFLFGILLAMRAAKKRGLNQEMIADFGVYLILSAVVGARIYYVMTHFNEFRGNLLAIINPFQDGRIGISGLVMYGGFIAATITGYVFFKMKKTEPLQYLDCCAPSVGIGIALTRIGCFMNGCCFGSELKGGPWGWMRIDYSAIGSPAGHYQRAIDAHGLFPSQLAESLGGIAIFVILIFVGRHKKYFAGLQVYMLIILYATLRFFIEMTRYIETTKIGPFSHNQIICIVSFAVFGYIVVKKLRASPELCAVKNNVSDNHHANDSQRANNKHRAKNKNLRAR